VGEALGTGDATTVEVGVELSGVDVMGSAVLVGAATVEVAASNVGDDKGSNVLVGKKNGVSVGLTVEATAIVGTPSPPKAGAKTA
jgi:hypothetical protein